MISNMEWIKERRKELGYSQEDLARMLQLEGYSVVRSTVGHWESGLARPPLNDPAFVRIMADILKIDSLTLLQLAGYQINTQHSDIAERVARILDTMTEDKQKLALRLIEQLM